MQHTNRSTKSRRAKAHGPRPVGSRSAFTLVEMLVAVSLVVLMMSLFATVFQLASGSIGTQRGMAENDQRARSFFVIIRNDLKNDLKKGKSFKNLIPFSANEDPAARAVIDFNNRNGYFYISENDLSNDADDVLQFTVKLRGTNRDIYVGKATRLASVANFSTSNEPDRDDGNPLIRNSNGNLTSDNSSDSVAAEISYFLRGGRLYRRVLLLRDPLDGSGIDTQPKNANGNSYFDFDPDNDPMTPPPAYVYRGNFWEDFDFSAHFSANGAVFNGVGGTNDDGLDNAGVGVSAIGKPVNRFGFSHKDGLPREYVGTGNGTFIGRFTHEETSNTRFRYPHLTCVDSSGSRLGNGNPMDWFAASGENAPATTSLTLNNEGVVQEFDKTFGKGSRRAEDLLLSNVHAFDIKVWDEKLGQFADVGHNLNNGSGVAGDFNARRNANRNYGPGGPSGNRVFDTWHPKSVVRGDGDPPFRPMRYYPLSLPLGSTREWAASTKYQIGDAVFPTNQDPLSPQLYGFAYRVVAVPAGSPDGKSGTREPFWPIEDGDRILDGGAGGVTWEAVANLRPLRAIQITIRYLDITSDQLRQVTLQISLLPEE